MPSNPFYDMAFADRYADPIGQRPPPTPRRVPFPGLEYAVADIVGYNKDATNPDSGLRLMGMALEDLLGPETMQQIQQWQQRRYQSPAEWGPNRNVISEGALTAPRTIEQHRWNPEHQQLMDDLQRLKKKYGRSPM